MINSYNHSLAPGTVKNRTIQAHLYLKFCLTYGVNYLAPTVMEVSMLAQFLGNSFAAISTVKNYLSGAKSWISHHCGNYSAFSAQEVADVMKFLSSTSNHFPHRLCHSRQRKLKSSVVLLTTNQICPQLSKPVS